MAKSNGLEQRIDRIETINQIQNLMSRYSYYHTAVMHRKCVDLFTTKTPGLKIEMVWGVYEGLDAAERCYARDHVKLEGEYGSEISRGAMHMHLLTTPFIEVAGDGKTAKGVWISPGCGAMVVDGKAEAAWAWLKYGSDFVKEDGKWKIWHLHVYPLFATPYDRPWTEVSTPPERVVEERRTLSFDGPPTTNTDYSPDRIPELLPVLPEPYETWNDSMSY